MHEDAFEYKWLNKYPAFTKEGMYYHIPAKVQVLHNIIQRMKLAKRKLTVTKDVYDFLQSPFKLKVLPASFAFHTSPMPYQEIALRYLYTVGSGGLLLDPGMGKSKVALDYIALMGFKKVIIICPKPLLFVWEDEIAVHRPELTYYTVKTTDWAAEEEGILNAQVTIINYNKAVDFQGHLAKVGYEFIHLDEFLIKDPTTDRTKTLTKLSQKIPYRCGGSGTLINNSIMDVFAPVRYLEPALVGGSAANFMDRHAVKKEVTRGEVTRKQVVAFKGKDEARSILESCCIVMTKEKWLQLPEKKFHDIYVQMTPEQKDAYYSLMRNYLITLKGLEIEVDNPLVMLSKLYQISNGFVYHTPKEEEDQEVAELLADDAKKRKKKSKRTTVFFEESGKVKALEELLTGKLSEKRAIIWFNMEAEYDIIKEMLDRTGMTYLSIKGGEAKTGEKVRKFNNDPSIQWLVCQAKSVNYGITVLGTTLEKMEESDFEVMPSLSPEVHTQVFYSMNFSLEVYLQQQDRIHRLGQKHVCDYYRIFANSPVEKRIREAIGDKMCLRIEMLRDIAETLKKEVDNCSINHYTTSILSTKG